MLPIKTRSIFKNRWIALLWAGGIVWSAAEFVQGQPHPAPAANGTDAGNAASAADGNPVSPSDVAAAKAALATFGQ